MIIYLLENLPGKANSEIRLYFHVSLSLLLSSGTGTIPGPIKYVPLISAFKMTIRMTVKNGIQGWFPVKTLKGTWTQVRSRSGLVLIL